MSPIHPIRRFFLIFMAGMLAIMAYGENSPEKAKPLKKSKNKLELKFVKSQH